jgi:hypothetical protein
VILTQPGIIPVRHSYRAYGLGINSTTCIAGLEACEPCNFATTLQFEAGEEPDWAKQGRALPARVITHQPAASTAADPAFVLTEHGNGQYYELSYSDGTRFVVSQTGKRVWGTFQPPLTSEDLATYFLGPVMGFLLRYNHVTCLHASAVEMCSRAVLFSGDAGNGKSTTAAALSLRGAPVISEDIVPLTIGRTTGSIGPFPATRVSACGRRRLRIFSVIRKPCPNLPQFGESVTCRWMGSEPSSLPRKSLLE